MTLREKLGLAAGVTTAIIHPSVPRPTWQAIAEAQAAQDRETLARLVVRGRVTFHKKEARKHPEFTRAIQGLVNEMQGGRGPINTAIRPKKKRRH